MFTGGNSYSHSPCQSCPTAFWLFPVGSDFHPCIARRQGLSFCWVHVRPCHPPAWFSTLAWFSRLPEACSGGLPLVSASLLLAWCWQLATVSPHYAAKPGCAEVKYVADVASAENFAAACLWRVSVELSLGLLLFLQTWESLPLRNDHEFGKQTKVMEGRD